MNRKKVEDAPGTLVVMPCHAISAIFGICWVVKNGLGLLTLYGDWSILSHPNLPSANESPEDETLICCGLEILLKAFKLPILLWDERFSTIGILREMELAGVKKKNIEKKIDSASATWILQGALDSMKE